MKKLTNQTPDTRDADDEFVESYGVSVNEQRYTPNLTDESICVNCDEIKSCSNICMDCIKKIVDENKQSALTDEQIEKWSLNTSYRNDVTDYYDGTINGKIEGAKAYRDGAIAEWLQSKIGG